jgi:UDP-N-acetylglucosamine--dolichyl-phosphate N-acetylglucosaminephosphotransferase
MIEFVLFFLLYIIGFFGVFIIAPPFIRRMHDQGLVGRDMNKYLKPKVAELGGVIVFLGFTLSIFIGILIASYFYLLNLDYFLLFASFCTISMITFIGVIDDIIGWKKGIRQWQHFLIPILAAIPLVVVFNGTSTIMIPFIGSIDFWIFYPLIIIPIAVTGASNAFNMLAGFNGLEAGQGIIITLALTIIALASGQFTAALFGLAMIGALHAFLKFNWFPAKIFGGDSLTLMIGANLAIMSIIGHIEIFGLLLFALFFVECAIKAKHRMKSECFGIPKKDGTLSANPKGGSLTQWIMKKGNNKLTETQVVFLILGIQFIISLVVILYFFIK